MTVLLTIIHVFGLITMGCSGLMSTSLVTSFFANDGATDAFLQGTLLTFFLGALMFLPTYRAPNLC
jgi:trk system potassium uptake protein TrkH